MVRKQDHAPSGTIGFRHLWGTNKRQELLDTAEADPATLYQPVTPQLELGLPFVKAGFEARYFEWPKLPDLIPTSFSGVKTARDEFLVDIDRDALAARVADYFNPMFSNDEIRARFPQVMAASDRFDPIETRAALLKRGGKPENIVRYAYRPFDVRWLYWEPETKLLDEKRADYWPHVVPGNEWITAAQALRKGANEPQYAVLTAVGSYHLIERASLFSGLPEYFRSGRQ